MKRFLPLSGTFPLLLAALPGTSSGQVPSSTPPNVLLITVDTLRPDALGWVSGENATPAIDRLAREGVRFPAAVSPVPLTLPSHASILTGLLPRAHGVRDNGQVVSATHQTLAQILKRRGYRTAAFVSGYPLRRLFGLDAGFDRYDDELPSGAEGWVERVAPRTSATALAWIRSARSPWFVWVHYYDPHDPYTPPPAFLRPGPRGAYDGEVAYVDWAVGELFRAIPVGGRANLVTVFAADHGESLGEHGEKAHGFFLYDTTVLVPLFFHAPGRLAPREIRAPARLIDIAPTVLDLIGAPPMRLSDGASLLPLLRGRGVKVGGAYLETLQPWFSYGWAPLSGFRGDEWKLIKAPRPELYDLSSDPAERTNLARQNRPKLVALAKTLERIEAGAPSSAERVDDPETIAKLRSLGYLGGGTSELKPPRDLPDPKDRLAERDMLLQGEALLRQRRFDAAVAVFDAVLAREKNNRFATLRSGIAFLKKGDLRAAIPRLEKAVLLDPEQPEARFALADALTRSGQNRRAVPHWMETARLQPRHVAAWSNLGTALWASGKIPGASTAFARAVEIEPGNPLLLANLAFTERALGKEAQALEHLKKAAAFMPEGKFPFSATLGLLCLKRGDAGEAARWLRRSRPGEMDYAEARFELAIIALRGGDRGAARQALAQALAAQPRLRARAESSALLAPLLR